MTIPLTLRYSIADDPVKKVVSTVVSLIFALGVLCHPNIVSALFLATAVQTRLPLFSGAPALGYAEASSFNCDISE
jgi:hypothetical protein